MLSEADITLNHLGGGWNILAHNNPDERVTVRLAALRDKQTVATDPRFGLVTTDPPDLPADAATCSQRAHARPARREGVSDCCKGAAVHLAADGELGLCHAAADPRSEEAIAAAGLVKNVRAPVIALYRDRMPGWRWHQ